MAKKREGFKIVHKLNKNDHQVKLIEDIQIIKGGRTFPKGTVLTVTTEKAAELIELKQAEKI